MLSLRRDPVTWLGYGLVAWFAYVQAAPGLVVPHLRAELGLSYSAGGLFVAAFAAGSMAAGLVSAPLGSALGRGTLVWAASAVMVAGAVGLTSGRTAVTTIAATLVMGFGGGLLLATVQGVLADHHGVARTVALAEANVAASLGYLLLVGALSLAAGAGAGWRSALLLSIAAPALLWWRHRQVPVDPPPVTSAASGRLPAVLWVATAMLFCTTAAEWCIAAWGSSFLEHSVELSADTAVAMMSGYFAGVVAGRVVGSRLARSHGPAPLLALALALAMVGFAIFWPATALVPALAGLFLLGVGLGNLFPLGVGLVVSVVPERAGLASGRAVVSSAAAIVLAPLAVGALADAFSIRLALGVVPVMIVLAAVGLATVRRAHTGDGFAAPKTPR